MTLPVGMICAVGATFSFMLYGVGVFTTSYPHYGGYVAVFKWISYIGITFLIGALSNFARRSRKEYSSQLIRIEHVALILIALCVFFVAASLYIDHFVIGTRFTSQVVGVLFMGVPGAMLLYAKRQSTGSGDPSVSQSD